MTAVPTGERRRQHIVVALPAYNEAAGLPALLDRIDESMFEAGLAYHVVVVDDGSSDGTGGICREYATRIPLTLVTHDLNQGLGATIRDGLVRAAQIADGRDIIVTMDADNSHTPELIQRMVRMVREGHDVVIASRFEHGAIVRGVPLLRRALSYWSSIFLRVVFPIHGVRDYTCGYRAYKASLIKGIVERHGPQFFEQEGFQCIVDILLRIRSDDLVFGEVPMVLRYDFKQGPSKMKVLKTIRSTLALMVRRRFES